MIAAIDSPMAARARVFFDDEHATATPRQFEDCGLSSGERLRRSRTDASMRGVRKFFRRAHTDVDYAPYEMIASASPLRRSAALPSGIGSGAASPSTCLTRGSR